MKNTLALAIIALGGMLVYGGYKDYSFTDTVRFFTGQKLQNSGTTKGFKDGKLQDHIPKKPNGFTPNKTPSTESGPPSGQAPK